MLFQFYFANKGMTYMGQSPLSALLCHKKNVIVDEEGQKYVMKIIKRECWANKIPEGRNGSCKMKKEKV